MQVQNSSLTEIRYVICDNTVPASFTVKSPKTWGQMPRRIAFLPGQTLKFLLEIYKKCGCSRSSKT